MICPKAESKKAVYAIDKLLKLLLWKISHLAVTLNTKLLSQIAACIHGHGRLLMHQSQEHVYRRHD